MAKATAKAAPTDPAELAVHETLKRAQRVWSSGLGTTLVLLKEADQSLSDQLHAIVQKHGGPTGKFTEASATVYRKQIQLATEYLEKRLAGHTHAQATKAIASSVKSTIATAKAFEHKFTGITRPLALESQQMQDAVVRGTGASLLQRHQASFNRYGKAMVSDFERVLRGAQIEGLTHEQTVSRLVASGKLGGHSAASLHQNEPGYFPEPTSYVKRRYWAERIVRTETAHALSAGALQAMNVTRQTEFPDLCKKILATFDNRTAPDSVAVHGQVRKLEEYFQDGKGRTYLHPPGRPNDREAIIPWRPHWEPTPSTQPPSAEVVAEAQVAAAPSPAGVKRKGELKDALQKAKAKVLGQKAQLEAQKQEAQAFSLAQAKAKAAQAAGEESLGHVVLADAQALKAAAEKAAHVVVPGAKFSAAKAKAQEYLVQKKAIAEAKAAAQAAERQAKAEALAAERAAALQQEVKGYKESWHNNPEAGFESHKDVTDTLKHLAKTKPKVFAELAAQVTGKPAATVLGQIGKPLQLGALAKQVGKKLQPQLDWPKPKPKKPPPLSLEQKKAKLLAPNVDLKAAAAAFTNEEIGTLIAGNPLVLGGELEEILAMSDQGKGAFLHQVVSDWEKLKAQALQAELKPTPANGKQYVDVYQGGKKTAYYFQEGTAAAPEWVVKPPLEMQGNYQPKTFTVQNEATAYAIEVGEGYAKLLAAKQAEAASIQAAAAKNATVAKSQAVAQRTATVKPWSPDWKDPVRPVADVKTALGKQLAHLKDDRGGVGLVMDEDYIEHFGVTVTREKVGARYEVVARFKVTAHRGEEVRARLTSAGARPVDYGYKRKMSLEKQALEYANTTIEQRPGGAGAIEVQRDGVKVTMLESARKKGEELAAVHNLVEIRFAEPADAARTLAKAKEGFGVLGIGTDQPSAKTLETYKRAKIMAYADPDSAKDLRALKERSPAAVQKVWEKSVLRNPRLEAIAADAELREVAPGHQVLYSRELSRELENSGVRWLSHTAGNNKGPDVIEMTLLRQEDGLLSSRERYQRGVFIEGVSTGRDFETGGADNAFLRLQTSDPFALSSRDFSSRWTYQIDPSETGRLDAYFTNFDNFGRAADSRARKTVAEMASVARENGLQADNELMLQRQVPRSAIRRVVARDAGDRDDLLARLRKQGLTEINGVPLEDFVVLRHR